MLDELSIKPIGIIYTDAVKVPNFWTISNVKGKIVIDMDYIEGLSDIQIGQKIIVVFVFHKSPDFTSSHFYQTPPRSKKKKGIFSTNSPVRPNPIGISVVDVIGIDNNEIIVKGLDILNETPVIDIKPYHK